MLDAGPMVLGGLDVPAGFKAVHQGYVGRLRLHYNVEYENRLTNAGYIDSTAVIEKNPRAAEAWLNRFGRTIIKHHGRRLKRAAFLGDWHRVYVVPNQNDDPAIVLVLWRQRQVSAVVVRGIRGGEAVTVSGAMALAGVEARNIEQQFANTP
jgi:hypothetical protein